MTLPCLRQLVASLRRTGFNPMLVHVGLVIDKGAMGQDVLYPLNRIPPSLILITLTLLLLELAGDTWKTLDKAILFGISRDKLCQVQV
jgi:hypothetical protein